MDNSDVVTFYDPHPGHAGAAIALPPTVLKIVKHLDKKKLPLQEALSVIQQAAQSLVDNNFFRKAEVKTVEPHQEAIGEVTFLPFTKGDPYISLKLIVGNPYPQYCFRVISYKRDAHD